MKYTLAKKHEMTLKPVTNPSQGRLFGENIDPALVNDWPEIEEQFEWLLHPEKVH